PWRLLAGDPLAVAAAVVLAAVGLTAAAASWVAPHDPLAIDLTSLLASPSLEHPLGTDQLGRDILSRIVFGARWSLGAALVVTVAVVGIGVAVGATCGYRQGRLDAVVVRVIDALMAFPTLLLALATVAVVGPGLGGVLVALVVAGWAGYARIVRSLVLSLRRREFVTAAQAAGAPTATVVIRHVLPNVVSPVVVLASLELGQLILALAGLSFLGLGVQAPTPEWGSMVNEGRPFLFTKPELMIYPGLAVSLVAVSFNVLGDRLRDLLDPRLQLLT
ncbi:MAG TPA: nickel transporter permease, partial [Acidimicrobiales bacterium]|nr:nickel transporter permease [Acidimicrobiales bacterium]